jgi:hypothetical protein
VTLADMCDYVNGVPDSHMVPYERLHEHPETRSLKEKGALVLPFHLTAWSPFYAHRELQV